MIVLSLSLSCYKALLANVYVHNIKHLPPVYIHIQLSWSIPRMRGAYSFGRERKTIVRCNDGKSSKSKVVHQKISRQIHFLAREKFSLACSCTLEKVVQIFFWMFANFFLSLLQQKLLCKLLKSKYLSTRKEKFFSYLSLFFLTPFFPESEWEMFSEHKR